MHIFRQNSIVFDTLFLFCFSQIAAVKTDISVKNVHVCYKARIDCGEGNAVSIWHHRKFCSRSVGMMLTTVVALTLL